MYAFYRVHGRRDNVELVRDAVPFNSQEFYGFYYNNAMDTVVAFNREPGNEIHGHVSTRPFFGDTRILLLNPGVHLHNDKYIVSPDLAYLLTQSHESLDPLACSTLIQLPTAVLGKQPEPVRVLNGHRDQVLGILGGLNVFPAVLDNLVVDYRNMELLSEPLLIMRFNCLHQHHYVIDGDVLFLAGLNARGDRTVISINLLDPREYKVPSLTLLRDSRLLAFGVYSGVQVFVDAKGITLKSTDSNGEEIQTVLDPFASDGSIVLMKQGMSINNLLYFFDNRYELVMINLRHRTSTRIRFENFILVWASLNQAGTLLVCTGYPSTLKLFRVECDERGEMRLVEWLSEEVIGSSVNFVTNTIFAARCDFDRHILYRVDEERANSSAWAGCSTWGTLPTSAIIWKRTFLRGLSQGMQHTCTRKRCLPCRY